MGLKGFAVTSLCAPPLQARGGSGFSVGEWWRRCRGLWLFHSQGAFSEANPLPVLHNTAASLPTDNSLQPKEAQPTSHALTSD
jgi:hypothetical protein